MSVESENSNVESENSGDLIEVNAKEKFFQEKLDELFNQFESFGPKEFKTILKDGWEQSPIGPIDGSTAKYLVEAFRSGIKMLPQILENLPKDLRLERLRLSTDPEVTFAEMAKEKLGWFEIYDLCKWNLDHQDPGTYSMESLELRADALSSTLMGKLTPEQVVRVFTKALPKKENLGTTKTLEILSSLPLETIEVLKQDEDSYRTVSAFSIKSLQNLDDKFLRFDRQGNVLPVRLARELSKRGLLDFTHFLEPEDIEHIEQELAEYYQKILERKIKLEITKDDAKKKAQKTKDISDLKSLKTLNESVSGEDEINFEISPTSQAQLDSYFGSPEIKLISEYVLSEHRADVSEHSNLLVGDKTKGKGLFKYGFPMHQFEWLYMPSRDLRLNFNFTNDYKKDGREQVEVVSKVMAFAQTHGIPVTSKLTLADDSEKHAGRVIFYTDYFQLKILLKYLKDNKLVELNLSRKRERNNVLMNISGDQSIEVRGNGEGFENDVDVLEKSFSKIIEELEN